MQGLKLQLMMMLTLNYLLAIGQADTGSGVLLANSDNQQLNAVLSKMAAVGDRIEHKKKWCYLECSHSRLFGIKHQPSRDFNIYFTFVKKVTPSIQAAMEVSLNYSGVVNLKSLIALRKKKR